MEKLNKDFFQKDARQVAKELLGKVLVRKIGNKLLKAKIVETEAYLNEKDPGSRARQNGDLRETMLMDAGTILVYGVHNNWLVNFVTNEKGKAEAVLLRALEPLNFDINCSGPGLLTRVLDINKSFHKKNILDNEELWIEEDLEESSDKEEFEIVENFRVGLKEDMEEQMRFYIKGNKFVSRK